MNQFDELTWQAVLDLYPERKYSIPEYFGILNGDEELPVFLNKYLSLPLMTRLKKIGLLCGTDWTSLYKNRFYYSRYDHSLGVALIIWHFTKDKAQTLAGLFHDVSTPVFSHVADFRKGDALTQSATEEPNAIMLKEDKDLPRLLAEDGLTVEQVWDYHKYPVADNEIPCLSADRLEYMFPSGMALEGSWTMEEIRRVYNDLAVLKNENGIDELGFRSMEAAETYCYRFANTGHLLQLNENKLTLQLLAEVCRLALEAGLVCEEDFMTLGESDVMDRFEDFAGRFPKEKFSVYYRTFRNMTFIEHTENALPGETHFSVSLKVKQRYINPLVLVDGKARRLGDVSEKAKKIISDFLSYEDSAYGCVKLIGQA